MWYLILLLLLVIAVAFMFFARRQQYHEYSILQANREVFEARKKELLADHKEGLLGDKDLRHAQRELEKAFVTDVQDPDEEISMRPVNILIPVLALVVLSVGVYLLDETWQQQRELAEARAQLPVLNEELQVSERLLSGQGLDGTEDQIWTFALGLRQRLADEPHGAGWEIYGRVMMELQQLEQALEAYQASLELAPERVSTKLAYTQALIFSGSDADLARAGRLMAEVLDEQPQNTQALVYLGLIHYEQGDYQRAARSWELTLETLAADDQRRQVIENLRAEAQERADGTIMTLTVTVDITEELRNEMPWNANLFVFVRDPDGGRAPVAVFRQQVSDLPVTVTLTDEHVMMEGQSLSDLDNWLVGARLTEGDTVDIQPGDMEARPRQIEREAGKQIELTLSELH